jgi:hypothetical protein
MARTTSAVPKFSRKQKVVAVNELPGVPAGTEGVVYYEAGLRWFRYHVAFANGAELGNIDGNDLVTLEEWKAQQQEARRAELIAAREARQAELLASVRPAGAGGH